MTQKKKKAKSAAKKKVVHRSAKNGRFVSEKYAKRYPKTTVKEVVK